MTILHQCLKTQRMKTGCVDCYRKECLLSWTTSKFEGNTTPIILSINIMAITAESTTSIQAKWKMPLSNSFFVLLVIYTHQKLGQSSRFALSYCLLIPSFHFPAGLAYGKAFPDRVLGTLWCIYGCHSFLGYHGSQWCLQSSGTLSNKRSSSGPGFAILLIW